MLFNEVMELITDIIQNYLEVANTEALGLPFETATTTHIIRGIVHREMLVS